MPLNATAATLRWAPIALGSGTRIWAGVPGLAPAASCALDTFGIVHLDGALTAAPAAIPAGAAICTIPIGYRPSVTKVHFPANAIGRLNIRPDGTVTCAATIAQGGVILLDMLTYPLINP